MKLLPRFVTALKIRPIYALIFAGTAVAQAVLTHIGAFDLLYRWSRAHEHWEIDEIFTTFSVLSFALMAVLIVRNKDVRRAQAEHRKAEARAHALARYDTLTGLANRQGFQEDIAARLSAVAPEDGRLVVMILDIDHFKVVNDSLGQAAGDKVLQQIADRLRSLRGPSDRAAHIGGDEFALLAGPLRDDDDIIRLARRALGVLGLPIHRTGLSAKVTVSIGIALYPGDGESGEILLQRAESALYRAKAAGRNTYALFDATHHQALHEQRETERALRSGIARGEIVTHFQPIFDLQSRHLVCVEALARWQRPDHGLIPPAVFIPIAEDLGLIGDLFGQVLRSAAEEAVRWPPTVPVAVNLSPLQLHDPDTAQRILAILDSVGLPPDRLEIEITESALLAEVEAARQSIQRLRRAGIHFALDDFGTGYANLHQLRDLPFDKVKIDRSFVMRLADPDTACLLERIIDLAHAMRLTVVAEGIETEAEAAWTRDHGCHHGQGYGLARPMPAHALLDMMAARP
ncbi:putative bifunctional diguanylate cyclase/phosphodiesterase [Zavarzinia aquatilis]|nr:EAL domain-containing protein [Zavarzinia aquatilis]